MGRRSRVIPCGTAPWRVPGAGRLRGRRAPRGWGRVAASRCPDRSGGASSGAGGQNRAGRRGRSPPRRSRRRPGAVGDATRGPPGSPRAQEPQASKGSRGQRGRCSCSGQQRTGGATRCQLWWFSPCAGAAAAVPGPGRGHPSGPGARPGTVSRSDAAFPSPPR